MDLLRMGTTWEEAEVAAQNKAEWCRSVAQYIHWMRVESRSRPQLADCRKWLLWMLVGFFYRYI